MVSRIIGLRNNPTQHYTKYIIIRVSLWLNSAAEKFESCYVLRINYYKSGVTGNVYRFGLDLWICGSVDLLTADLVEGGTEEVVDGGCREEIGGGGGS